MPDIAVPRFVYRSARNKNWITPIGEIGLDAFRRRPPDNPHPDTNGISVALTYEAAVAFFGDKANKGIIRIDTVKLAERGYSVVPDSETHGCIPELPFDTEDTRSEVLAAAEALIQCSETEYNPHSN